jgi:cellulose synthase/poly-beta-1,6-N-acetylglucosamine synthase-like glycosyltransferase
MSDLSATIVVPCRHEEGNVGPLLGRLHAALAGRRCEVLFVDDSDDAGTVNAVHAAAARLAPETLVVTTFHRSGVERDGGLAGAVIDGFRRARADRVVVMDADLQHPPELVPVLLDRLKAGGDLVVASRYRDHGSADGLDGPLRHLVSRGSTWLAKLTFPILLRGVSDPMTGFFALRLDAVDLDALRSRGFKILLEVLVRHPRLTRSEVPLRFGVRYSGDSKGDAAQGFAYLRQLPRLRLAAYLASRRLRWAAAALALALGGLALAVAQPSGTALLAGLLLCVALFNTATSSLEVRWRLYGWRTPEAIERMRWPTPPYRPAERFSLIVPALHEAAVIASTLRRLLDQQYPHCEIVVSLCEGDDDTIAEVRRVMDEDDPGGRIKLVVRRYAKSNKPRQLNAALSECTGTVVGVIDAEDDVAAGLLARVDAMFSRTGADVVQGGVQLMTLGRGPADWFKVHNVLEYFFWFTSRMFYQVKCGFVPLGGNTVFIRRNLLIRAGGWPDNLTEDCALGVLLCTRYGAKVVAAYDPELATREEVPQTIWDREAGSLFYQRVRWNQGFLSILLQGQWLRLPTLKQRLLAGYILGTPFLQGLAGLLLPLALVTIFWLKVPVGIAMLMYAPLLPISITLVTQVVGLREFGQAYRQPVGLRHYVYLIAGAPAYQWVLMAAAFWATVRHVRGHTNWHKTNHTGDHRLAEAHLPPYRRTPVTVRAAAMESA